MYQLKLVKTYTKDFDSKQELEKYIKDTYLDGGWEDYKDQMKEDTGVEWPPEDLHDITLMSAWDIREGNIDVDDVFDESDATSEWFANDKPVKLPNED